MFVFLFELQVVTRVSGKTICFRQNDYTGKPGGRDYGRNNFYCKQNLVLIGWRKANKPGRLDHKGGVEGVGNQ